jgi:hypothetical protein
MAGCCGAGTTATCDHTCTLARTGSAGVVQCGIHGSQWHAVVEHTRAVPSSMQVAGVRERRHAWPCGTPPPPHSSSPAHTTAAQGVCPGVHAGAVLQTLPHKHGSKHARTRQAPDRPRCCPSVASPPTAAHLLSEAARQQPEQDGHALDQEQHGQQEQEVHTASAHDAAQPRATPPTANARLVRNGWVGRARGGA